jgi:hypothetical protein
MAHNNPSTCGLAIAAVACYGPFVLWLVGIVMWATYSDPSTTEHKSYMGKKRVTLICLATVPILFYLILCAFAGVLSLFAGKNRGKITVAAAGAASGRRWSGSNLL